MDVTIMVEYEDATVDSKSVKRSYDNVVSVFYTQKGVSIIYYDTDCDMMLSKYPHSNIISIEVR